METFWTVLIAVGLPSAIVGGIVGIFFHRIEKKMDKEREARRKYELFQVKIQAATISLCKANAIALKNGKCNGETSEALDYLNKVKHEQWDFLTEQGIDHLF